MRIDDEGYDEGVGGGVDYGDGSHDLQQFHL